MNAACQMVSPAVSVRIGALVAVCRAEISRQVDHLNDLDCAIGDGDHGTNMLRGCDALLAECDQLDDLSLAEALLVAGRTVVMTVGGASGPLYGTLLMELGSALEVAGDKTAFSSVFAQAVDAVAKRGKAQPGDKTLLDVLDPVRDLLTTPGSIKGLPAKAAAFAEATIPMRAMRGRASFLGQRSVGHMDPGAASCAFLIAAMCRELEGDYGK